MNADGLRVLRHEDLVSLVRGRVTGAAPRTSTAALDGSDGPPTVCAGPCGGPRHRPTSEALGKAPHRAA